MATITINSQPNQFEPLMNDVWYSATSASSGLSNFKYIFQPQWKAEPFATASYTTLNKYKVPPRVGGLGVYSPSTILKSYLDMTYVNPYQTAWVSGFNGSLPGIPYGLLSYNVKYGSEYNPSLSFISTSLSSGKLALGFEVAHNLLVGDLLIIDKDNKNVNSNYDGTCSVAAVINSFSVRTDKTYGEAVTGESGAITTLQRISATSSERFGWACTKQYDEKNINFGGRFVLASQSTTFLSNWVGERLVREDDWETISMILGGTISYIMNIDAYDAAGNQLTLQPEIVTDTWRSTISTSNGYRRVDFGIGPNNLDLAGTWDDINFDTVSTYKAYVKLGGTTVSNVITYRVDRTCTNYEKVRFLYLNRAGGWDYFTFIRDQKKSMTVNRTEYQRELDWNYTLGQRSKSILNTKAENIYVVHSDWITDDIASNLEEMISSPEVYIVQNTNVAADGWKLPIIITDTTWESKTYLRNELFNAVVSYKLSNDINLQNQ